MARIRDSRHARISSPLDTSVVCRGRAKRTYVLYYTHTYVRQNLRTRNSDGGFPRGEFANNATRNDNRSYARLHIAHTSKGRRSLRRFIFFFIFLFLVLLFRIIIIITVVIAILNSASVYTASRIFVCIIFYP